MDEFLQLELPYLGHTAAQLFRAFSDGQSGYIWESAHNRRGAVTEVGILPQLTLEIRDNWVRATEQGRSEQRPLESYGNNPLTPIAEQMEKFPGTGFLAYDAGRYFETISGLTPHSETPDAYYISPAVKIIIDRNNRRLRVVTSKKTSAIDSLVTQLEKYVENTHVEHLSAEPEENLRDRVLANENFIAQVRRAKEYIYAGDVFQVVLGQEIAAPARPDPLRSYERLRALNPSPYHFLVRFNDSYLVGASPELFLQSSEVRPTTIRMRPVAGTYGRASATFAPTELRSALVRDEKERAEHIMLVDHARNDIGRVSQIGSVSVTDLCSVETYRDVHHMVSEVCGTLRDNESIFSAFRSCFPIATLTGTPKIRAMEIIAELEKKPRGLFGGSVFSYSQGRLDSSVIIRSMVITPASNTIWAGAGIVADSDPEREHRECLLKANAVLRATAEAL